MPELLFLTYEQVLYLHERSIERFGGSYGIRDGGLLEAALAMPQAGFGGEYLHATLFDKAAAYLYHVVKNHPFIDGNKRTGFGCAETFLDLNGYHLQEKHIEALYTLTLRVASEAITKEEIAQALEKYSLSLS